MGSSFEDGLQHVQIRKGEKSHKLHRIANDKLIPKGYRKLLRKILTNSKWILIDGSGYFIFFGLYEVIPTAFFIGRILGTIKRLIVWKKSGLRQSWSPDFRDGQECAFFGRVIKDEKVEETERYWDGTKSQTTMFDESSYSRSRYELPSKGHPCPKPVPIIANFIELTLGRGGVVFDPLLGSGTTLVAAEVTGRLAVGIELIPAFVALTLDRAEIDLALGKPVRTTLDKLPGVLSALLASSAAKRAATDDNTGEGL